MGQPINLNPLISVALQTAPAVNAALADREITVAEAIDIAARRLPSRWESRTT